MPLTAGARIGTYEIVSAIGAGGMGEVYLAHDSRLKRDVALKVLPDALAQDPDRVARFQREAELLATLNHPNIAAVYGLEQLPSSTGQPTTAIAMELVDGDTLGDRIARGPLPIDDALDIAKQIADALEFAHDRGVVHRDLKPANVKVTTTGQVKVLDFGLAKMMEAGTPGASSNASMSPTLSIHATMAGVILGTAAYMSPEQARGKPVDRRADIWAFGCVLFEMLAGRQTFEPGETISDSVAAIIKNEPDWAALPKDTPAYIRSLLRRCLQKDLRKRLPHIAVARIEIEEGTGGPTDAISGAAAPASRTRALIPGIAAALALGIAGVLATMILRHREPSDFGLVRLSISAPEGSILGHNSPPRGSGLPAPQFAPSPDGRRLAYVMYANGKPAQLWIHRLDTLGDQARPGTDDASFPFWSPDNRFIAFFAQGKLKRIDASGGAPQTICDAPAGEGGTWNRDGDIVFAADDASGLSRVSASGGVPTAATTLDGARKESSHRWPQFLPDGRRFLYVATTGAVRGRTVVVAADTRAVYAGSLDGGAATLVLPKTVRAQYAGGRLIFMRGTTLVAQPFDPKSLRLAGEAVPLAEDVAANPLNARSAFSASDGVLAYRVGRAVGAVKSKLAWFNRSGKELGSVGAGGDYTAIQLAPDGKSLAAYIPTDSSSVTNAGDIWILDLARGGIASRFTLTADRAKNGLVWSPDGARLAFSEGPDARTLNDLYAKPTAGIGDAELLLKSPESVWPTSWSPDGRALAITRLDSKAGRDIFLLPLADRKAVPLIQTPFDEDFATFSPDGRRIAFSSTKGGLPEVYVRGFPTGEREWRISEGGGNYPLWRSDGKELFYLDEGRSAVVAVAINAGATFNPAPPTRLFTVPIFRSNLGFWQYAVSADGQRILIVQPESGVVTVASSPIVVVINWAGQR